MKVGRKMMRSFRRREKMSNARSPRGVCSTTIGTRAIKSLLVRLRFDIGVGDEQLEGHAITQPLAHPVEVAALLHHTPDGGRRPFPRLGDPPDPAVHVSLGG